jgi:hypothetical protein
MGLVLACQEVHCEALLMGLVLACQDSKVLLPKDVTNQLETIKVVWNCTHMTSPGFLSSLVYRSFQREALGVR